MAPRGLILIINRAPTVGFTLAVKTGKCAFKCGSTKQLKTIVYFCESYHIVCSKVSSKMEKWWAQKGMGQTDKKDAKKEDKTIQI